MCHDLPMVSPSTVSFTGGPDGNWNTPQNLRLRVIHDDNAEDRKVRIDHHFSGYDGASKMDSQITARITDDDRVGSTVTPSGPARDKPTISGTAQVGETLTADTSAIADSDGLGTFGYQWLADGSAISGATGSSYTLTASDQGKAITVRVSFIDGDGSAESVTSAATDPVAGKPQPGIVNSPATGKPTISGTAQVGETLTANTSAIADADGLGTFGYQWLADGSAISGATGSSYTLTASDQGKAITVRVSFTDNAGNAESVTSAATDPVAGKPQSVIVISPVTEDPTISGTAQVGETLTAGTFAIADADGLGTFSYQWLADDSSISGATSSSYTLTDADAGKTITVQVNFTDDAGNAESVTSAATDPVAGKPQSVIVISPVTEDPTISGTAQVGETLTAGTFAIADADGLGTFSYQWLADGSSISGATSSNYTLTDADEGKTITAQVSITDNAGNAESVTNAATGYRCRRTPAGAGGPERLRPELRRQLPQDWRADCGRGDAYRLNLDFALWHMTLSARVSGERPVPVMTASATSYRQYV